MPSNLSLDTLLGFDAAQWERDAEVWRRLAKDAQEAANQLVRGTRDLINVWQHGVGSETARESAAKLWTEMDKASERAKTLADAYSQHGYAMRGLQNQAEMILASARQAGYTVDRAAGTITTPPGYRSIPGLDRMGQEIAGMLADLRVILESARNEDDVTAAVIRDNRPPARPKASWVSPGMMADTDQLLRRIMDPTHRPTLYELQDLRALLERHGDNQVFAYTHLNNLGAQGLADLNARLATLLLPSSGTHSGEYEQSVYDQTAGLVGDLQGALGVMLSAATQQTGHLSEISHGTYVAGEYELSPEWIDNFIAVGRSQIAVEGLIGPDGRSSVNAYGYQLLGPLLRGDDYDSAFLSTVGADMIDFEMEQGKGSALWTEARVAGVRLDWTQDVAGQAPAGYDPVNSLMDALEHNGDATREILTGNVLPHDTSGPEGGRMPRLDYLLTDREWNTSTDVPLAWNQDPLSAYRDDYKSEALDKFGTALERATTDEVGKEGGKLFAAIIHELSMDEEAAGYTNREERSPDRQLLPFAESEIIDPQLRDSMARITAEYIVPVHENILGRPPGADDILTVDSVHLTRFLAELGKDEGALRTVADAETVATVTRYNEILSGSRNPQLSFEQNLLTLQDESKAYGRVIGALDFGAGEQLHQDSADAAAKHNEMVEQKYALAGTLVEGAIAAVPFKYGLDGLATGVAGEVLEGMEESRKGNYQAEATYEYAATLGASQAASSALVEAAIYSSGKLEDMPRELLREGQLIPMAEWGDEQRDAWQDYKNEWGGHTVVRASSDAQSYYGSGYTDAERALTKTMGGGTP